MKLLHSKKERRRNDKIIIVERRKGKIWMYAEILLAIGLILYLLRLLV